MTKARIYKPARGAMQSAQGKASQWMLEFDRREALQPESLMGWTQSGDTMNQIRIPFDTLEEAEGFAKRNHLDFIISESQQRRIRPRNYGDNFKYIPAEDN